MIIIVAVLGLILGSFANAAEWRLDQKKFSIWHGRSVCPHCKHELASRDLVPLFSWLALRGQCRYCHKPISWQYPLVELLGAVLFATSYTAWDTSTTKSAVLLALWFVYIVGFLISGVHDIKKMLLPDSVTATLAVAGVAYAVLSGHYLQTLFAVVLAGGVFHLLYTVSHGRWMGFGDVKLGYVLGLVLGTPQKAFLMLFAASLIGVLAALPGMVGKRVTLKSTIPFGPCLMLATILVVLWGQNAIDWYANLLEL